MVQIYIVHFLLKKKFKRLFYQTKTCLLYEYIWVKKNAFVDILLKNIVGFNLKK